MNKIIKKKSIRHTLRSEYANKWNLFGSISYNGNLNIDSCNYQFYRLEKYLKKVFKLPFEIIYTTELNEVRGTGHHNHFVARVCSENDYMPLKRLIDAFFRNASLGLTDIRKYNQHLDGFGYILKDVDRLKDGFGIVNSGL
nr:hypothetical protein [uncultured Carboxylicivirga sp.]